MGLVPSLGISDKGGAGVYVCWSNIGGRGHRRRRRRGQMAGLPDKRKELVPRKERKRKTKEKCDFVRKLGVPGSHFYGKTR